MAHIILYSPIGPILSSSLNEIPIEVDGDYVDVKLTAYGGIVLLSERYFAYGGQVTLCEVASLIETFMRSSGQSYAEFTLKVFSDTQDNKTDSCRLQVQYCDRFSVCTDLPKFLKENFLTTLPIRRVVAGASVSLFMLAVKNESLKHTVACRFLRTDNDSIGLYTFTVNEDSVATETDTYQIDVAQENIIDMLIEEYDLPRHTFEILSFSIICGQRSVSFLVDHDLEEQYTFLFRNCFNILDVFNVPTVTTEKTDVERSVASVNSISRFYNQATSKSYEVKTGPLTSDEAQWIDQLFTAEEVYRFVPNIGDEDSPYIAVPILITDFTCEISHDDEKPNTAKFTWRYADNRPFIHLSASLGIFTSEYDTPFS